MSPPAERRSGVLAQVDLTWKPPNSPSVCEEWLPPSSADGPIAGSRHGPCPWAYWHCQYGSPGPDGGTVCWPAPAEWAAREPAAETPARTKRRAMKNEPLSPGFYTNTRPKLLPVNRWGGGTAWDGHLSKKGEKVGRNEQRDKKWRDKYIKTEDQIKKCESLKRMIRKWKNDGKKIYKQWQIRLRLNTYIMIKWKTWRRQKRSTGGVMKELTGLFQTSFTNWITPEGSDRCSLYLINRKQKITASWNTVDMDLHRGSHLYIQIIRS